MKKQILLFLFMLFGLLIKAQETKVFLLDLANPNENSLTVKGESSELDGLEIKTKELLAIELINANPFKYEYKISNKIIDFFIDDKKDVFDNFKLTEPAKENVDSTRDDINDFISDLDKQLLMPNLNDGLTKDFFNYMSSIEAFINNEKLMISSLSNVNNLILETEIEFEDGIDAEIDIEKIEENIKGLSIETFGSIKELSFKRSKREINKSRSDIKNSLNEIFVNYLIINKEFSRIESETKKYTLEALLKLTTEMDFLSVDIENYKKEISKKDFLEKNSFLLVRENFQNRLNKIIDKVTQLNFNVSQSKIEDLIIEYNKEFASFSNVEMKVKQNLSDFFNVKLDHFIRPIDFNGDNIDAIQINVTRTSISNRTVSDEITYTIWVRGGVKFDVSAGIFLNSLVDNSYGKKDVTDTENNMEVTKQMIFIKETNPYQIGFGSTLNISPRLGASWIPKPILSFGAMIREDQRFQVIAGGGFTLGKKQRILLQYGTVIGTVTRLANNFNLNETFEISGSDETIPTVQKFKFGHFFGITYNLGRTTQQTNK